MNEYELYTLILAPSYMAKKQDILIEEKLEKPQKATIIDNGIEAYTLYRFNENENFLPFFNNTHEGERGPVEYPTPKGLRKFCDYILLAVTHNKMYVILIEMKSGSNGDAQLQLSASSTFMKYIQMTAERIKSQNHFDTFDSNNIIIKKVILKPKPTPRPTTNIAKDSSINWTADPVIIKGEVFPINKLCCHN